MTETETLSSKIDPAIEAMMPKVAHAQETLIDKTVSLAVQTLYETQDQRGFHVVNEAGEVQNQAEVLKTLRAMPDENARTRAFNQLAKANKLDLSLKTSGHKSAESISRKTVRRNIDVDGLTDLARVTVTSGDVDVLDRFSTKIQSVLRKTNPDGFKAINAETDLMEDWQMRSKGLLHKVLKVPVEGVNSEIQFLPRQMARTASRITHQYYNVTRNIELLGAVEKSGAEDAQTKAQIVAEYNALAGWLNQMGDPIMHVLDKSAVDEANKILQNKKTDIYSIDEGVDVDGGKKSDEGLGSPILKEYKDLIEYRGAMQTLGSKVGLFPLPTLDENPSKEQLNEIFSKLTLASQITHLCFMKDAPDKFRQMTVDKAREINAKAPGTIPDAIVDYVAYNQGQGVDPPQPSRAR